MRYAIQLALAALLLFSVSAALSLWLYQNRQPSDAGQGGDKEKAGKKADDKGPKEPEPRPAPKSPDAGGTAIDPAAVAAARDREARLGLRAAQIEMILKDIQSEREAVEALQRQVIAEIKQAASSAAPRPGELEAKAAELEKRKTELDGAERKNIERIAAMCDTMPPESAALILRQLADAGRMDTAVRVLAQMKERTAARVLAEFGDPALAAQLVEKLRALRTATPPPAGTPPPGGTIPAGGPARP